MKAHHLYEIAIWSNWQDGLYKLMKHDNLSQTIEQFTGAYYWSKPKFVQQKQHCEIWFKCLQD